MISKGDFLKQNKKKIIIISILLAVAIAISHIVAFLWSPTKYVSETQLTTKIDIDSKRMETIVQIIKSESPAVETCEKLGEKGVYHSNGTPITAAEIEGGLSDWYTNTSGIISIYFYSTDDTIIKEVLDTHVQVSISYIEAGITYLENQIVVTSSASNPVKAKNNRYQIILGLPIVIGIFGFGCIKASDSIIKSRRRKISI